MGGPFVDVDAFHLAGQRAFLGDALEEGGGVAQAEAAGHDVEDDVAILAGMDGGGEFVGRAGAVGAGTGRIAAGVGRIAGGVHQGPDHRGLLGDIEVLAETGALALAQRDADVGSGLDAGVERGLRVADGNRRTVAVALQGDQAASGFDGEVGGGAIGVRAVLAVGGDGCVDQAGELVLEVLVAEIVSGHEAGVGGLDQHIGGAEQGEKVIALGRRIGVDYDAALAEADMGPVERAAGVGVGEGRQSAGGGAVGRLDLDHLRAQVGEDAPGHFGPRGGDVDDSDAIEQRGREVLVCFGHASAPSVGRGFGRC